MVVYGRFSMKNGFYRLNDYCGQNAFIICNIIKLKPVISGYTIPFKVAGFEYWTQFSKELYLK